MGSGHDIQSARARDGHLIEESVGGVGSEEVGGLDPGAGEVEDELAGGWGGEGVDEVGPDVEPAETGGAAGVEDGVGEVVETGVDNSEPVLETRGAGGGEEIHKGGPELGEENVFGYLEGWGDECSGGGECESSNLFEDTESARKCGAGEAIRERRVLLLLGWRFVGFRCHTSTRLSWSATSSRRSDTLVSMVDAIRNVVGRSCGSLRALSFYDSRKRGRSGRSILITFAVYSRNHDFKVGVGY